MATEAELEAKEDKIVKLEAFDSSKFHAKSHLEDDKTNYAHLNRGSINLVYMGATDQPGIVGT